MNITTLFILLLLSLTKFQDLEESVINSPTISSDFQMPVEKAYSFDVSSIYQDIMVGQVSDNLWVLANKDFPLPKDFEPRVAVLARVKQKYGNTRVSEVIHKDLVAMFEAAKADGIGLVLSSGYRDYSFQASLFQQEVNKVGEEEANLWVARPGESEHQTGLAVDITTEAVDLKLTQDFDKTDAFRWLRANAWRFGFILRYPDGLTQTTGYSYEPWHYRYLGHPEAARYIWENDLTLEGFMEAIKAQVKRGSK